MKEAISRDMQHIYEGLSDEEKTKFQGKTILFTGGAGFLGFYFINFFLHYQKELEICKVICLDNFWMGYPGWLKELSKTGCLDFFDFNVTKDDISSIHGVEDVDYIYHMASIASPIFYRKYPIETLDANVWGLRRIMDFYCNKNIKGLAFFSSSEIYGNPTPENIPTPETYRGNVDCHGPRACYDESKRFGETMCYLYHLKYQMPITIIRPFNNYGPGMRLNDARAPADFANAIYKNSDIVLFSDGRPTRTFCYISDAITGYLKALLYARKGFEAFNIGMSQPEISIRKLAEIYMEYGQEMFDYTGKIRFATSEDKQYLQNNPDRRCPDINKARKLLDYHPQIKVEQGVRYFLEYIKECPEEELVW